jgi:hypothetical protein
MFLLGKIIFMVGINWFFINTVICIEFYEYRKIQWYVRNIGYFDVLSLLCVVVGILLVIQGLVL